jgi:hypothetical protein
VRRLSAAIETSLVVRFCGRALVDPETGVELAALGEDGTWRTPDGVETDGLCLPVARVRAQRSEAAVAKRNRDLDAAWLEQSLGVVERLADELERFTTDEVWARLESPPREGRQLGALMRAAARAGWIEQTDSHRPSTRPNVNRRPVRIWRSLRRAQPQLGGGR